HFGNFIQKLYFLNKLCAFTNDEINKRHIGKLQYAYEQKVYHEYEYNLNNNNRPFCQYLKNNEVSLDEAIFLGKELHQKYNSSFRFDDKFISDCMKNDTINKLKDKEFIVTGRWNDDEISEETTSILFNLKKSKKEDEFFNIEQPKETFDNVCLNEETKNKILSTINQTKHSDKIFNEWGININYGKGITMNFAGLPGTGKTLTAKAVANYLGKDLLTIKFSELESPWVGVCEKNISKAFKNAKEKNAVLFFDEADSLTTKREGAVNWVVSRTNTLLKELECFEGVCIFATNFSENYDEAFNRRLTAHIQFTLPDEINLNKIFKIHFPNKKAPHKNVDFSKFSKKHVGNLSGGDVKNIVLNSARIASSEGANKIAMKHLESACDMVLTGKQNLNNYRDTTYMG
ncbi:MAG: ATP-binding protein, partial [Candidatus Woesearchaeota archaeon]